MLLENAAGIRELLAEGEGVAGGYVTLARVLAGRREVQPGSREVGAADDVLGWVEGLVSGTDAGSRVRVRVWRRGGQAVRGVVSRIGTAAGSAASALGCARRLTS